jgi:hypothetical protein
VLSRLMTRREQALILGLAVAIVIGSVTLYVDRKWLSPAMAPAPPVPVKALAEKPIPARALKAEREPRAPVPPPAPAPVVPGEPPQTAPPKPAEVTERADIAVGVTGAVRKPGLYKLKVGCQVSDLIASAGGLNETADTRTINFAATLIDGTTLFIPDQTPKKGVDASAANPPEYLVKR